MAQYDLYSGTTVIYTCGSHPISVSLSSVAPAPTRQIREYPWPTSNSAGGELMGSHPVSCDFFPRADQWRLRCMVGGTGCDKCVLSHPSQKTGWGTVHTHMDWTTEHTYRVASRGSDLGL